MINWSKYFDRIYCINFVQFKTRKQLVQFELKRVGILNSGIFEWHTTYPDISFNAYITEKFNTVHNISLMLGHYDCMRDALYNGYEKILILEDDIRFLKDINKIQQIIQHRPEDGNLILYDKMIDNYGLKNHFKPVNEYFSTFRHCFSAACYQLDKIGMQKIIFLIETEPRAADNYFLYSPQFLYDIKYYCSNTNIAVQASFLDCYSINTFFAFSAVNWQMNYKRLELDFNEYMMRKDGSTYNYGDYIQLNSINPNILYLTKNKSQSIDITKPIEPTTINIFLVVTVNQIDKLYPILYSLLKYSQSKFNIYIMLDKQNIQKYYQLFKMYQTDRMTITLMDNKIVQQTINIKCNYNNNLKLPNLIFSRLLLTKIFPNLDRILYLDYDIIFLKEGIEWLYNMDFEDNYVIGYGTFCIPQNLNFTLQSKEHFIFKHITKDYINAGVMLLNLKKIREEKEKEIIDILQNEPFNSQNNEILKQIKQKEREKEQINFYYNDQSITNYIFKNKILICNPIFNSCDDNLIKGIDFPLRKTKILQEWTFKDDYNYKKNVIIAHFALNKPWDEQNEIEVIRRIKNTFNFYDELKLKYNYIKEETEKQLYEYYME